MKSLPTIRARLSMALVIVALVWGAAVSAAVWLTVRHEVDELLDLTLRESAEILHGLLRAADGHWLAEASGALATTPHEEHLVWQIVGADGQVLTRSYRAPATPLTRMTAQGWTDAGQAWRVFAMPFRDDGQMLYVAQEGAERREARLEAAGYTAGSALLVGLLCALWMRSRVAVELDPITEMSVSVDRFEPGDGAAALPLPRRGELVPMHRAIVDLARRLSQRIANERAFAAHAAHALRTPLAGMVTQLAVAQRLAGGAVKPHLDQTREAADRLQRVVTALLTMFRSGGVPQLRTVQLRELLPNMRFGDLQVDIEADASLRIDPDLIAAALMNLLDNAARLGARHAVVSYHAPTRSIRVTDDGPGMTEAKRHELQSALDEQDYHDHTGLGMMLADLVARAHGGHLHLCPLARGCMVEILLGERPDRPATEPGAHQRLDRRPMDLGNAGSA
ncbi:MAG: sensor histidine kinase [Rubrivivax sp.]